MDFPTNSHKAKAEEPKNIKPVVTGDVKRRKTPLGRRFAETFVGGDAKTVGNYIFFEVLIPAAKDTISDAFSQAVDRMLFGDRGVGRSRTISSRMNTSSGHVSYNRFSQNNTMRQQREQQAQGMSRRQQFKYEEVILETRAEGEDVLERMRDLVETYEVVTVADLYSLIGVSSEHTDGKWGWAHNVVEGRVTRVPGGYLLDLPRPEPVD
jgi:hypothetical protein